ncbi:MAG: DUF2239 family protein [Pseudomonadota bacterium]|nr:DUF2239 family protein [Pseudomonadota bacterium]
MIKEDAMGDSVVCFCGSRRIAEGALAEVAASAWRKLEVDPASIMLTFNRQTGAVVDLNLSGSLNDVAARYLASAQTVAKRGRPKLGVVAREITLLPRHWEWLAKQPGGASVALRRLVETARKETASQKNMRIAATYKFMAAIAGDLQGFEEASRALFAQQMDKFENQIAGWPPDICAELKRLLAPLEI